MTKQKSDNSQFFQEATLCLCGSLDLCEALTNFFNCLKTKIPVLSIFMGRRDNKSEELEMVAYVDNNHAETPFQIIPFTEIQKQIINGTHSYLKQNKILFDLTASKSYLDIHDKESIEALFYKELHETILTLPGVYIRFDNKDEIIGSVVISYEEGFHITPALHELLAMLEKPLRIAFSNCLQHRELTLLKSALTKENQKLKNLYNINEEENIIGANGGMRSVIKSCRLAAASQAPVYIHGETGTGKEIIAHFLHSLSIRYDKPFIVINCAAIPPTLIDSELFGHEKGSFTGAVSSYKGRIERAQGGTLFLDEVAELPKDMQSRLLRVLESYEIERVGGNKSIKVDFRLICATHQDINQMVKNGDFREDLFYRLHVIPMVLPPLRERREDIPQLVQHFIMESALRYSILPPRIASGEMEKLIDYPWYGNVRELKNAVEAAMAFAPQGPLIFHNIKVKEKTSIENTIFNELPTYDDMCKKYFQKLLVQSKGKISGKDSAAEMAGMNHCTLRSKLQKLNII